MELRRISVNNLFGILNYDIDLVEKEKKILVKLKREILLKRFQTYHLTDDELDQFIFTRYKTSLEWDDFFYKANLNYPKFIHDELIYRIYNLQMFTYDNLFIFKICFSWVKDNIVNIIQNLF